MPRVRDGRRRELRQLLVAAANAARLTRQGVVDTAASRGAARPVRERISVLFAAAR